MPLGHSHIGTMLCWKSWLLSACHIVIVLIQLLIKEAGLCIVWYKYTHAREWISYFVHAQYAIWHGSGSIDHLRCQWSGGVSYWCCASQLLGGERASMAPFYTYSHSSGAMLVQQASGVSMSSICSLHKQSSSEYITSYAQQKAHSLKPIFLLVITSSN